MTRRDDDGFDLAFLLWLIPGAAAGPFFANGWTVAAWIATGLTALAIAMDLAARRSRRTRR